MNVSSTKFNDIINENYMLNLNQLLETCIIPTDNKQTNFEYVPIYYFNGSNRRADTPLLVEFNIVISLLINKFPSFKNQLLTLGKFEMENNLLSNKSMEESISTREQELLLEINKLKEENLKLVSENTELNNKLSLTEQLLLEVREQKDIIIKEKEEAERRHQESMEKSKKH